MLPRKLWRAAGFTFHPPSFLWRRKPFFDNRQQLITVQAMENPTFSKCTETFTKYRALTQYFNWRKWHSNLAKSRLPKVSWYTLHGQHAYVRIKRQNSHSTSSTTSSHRFVKYQTKITQNNRVLFSLT